MYSAKTLLLLKKPSWQLLGEVVKTFTGIVKLACCKITKLSTTTFWNWWMWIKRLLWALRWHDNACDGIQLFWVEYDNYLTRQINNQFMPKILFIVSEFAFKGRNQCCRRCWGNKRQSWRRDCQVKSTWFRDIRYPANMVNLNFLLIIMIETYDNFRFIECDNDNKTTTIFLFQIYHYLSVTYIKL